MVFLLDCSESRPWKFNLRDVLVILSSFRVVLPGSYFLRRAVRRMPAEVEVSGREGTLHLLLDRFAGDCRLLANGLDPPVGEAWP